MVWDILGGSFLRDPSGCKKRPHAAGARVPIRRSAPMQRGARFAFCEMRAMQRGARFFFPPERSHAARRSFRNS